MTVCSKRSLFPFIVFTAVLLTACGAAPSPTDTLDVIYTSAAQTIVSQNTMDAQSIASEIPTLDPNVTAIDNPSPTNLPPLEISPLVSSAATVDQSGNNCDSASFLADVSIPDHTVVGAGQNFVKTWLFQNTGSCTWDSTYTLTFVRGDQMNGTSTSIGDPVVAGQQVELSVALIAPTTAGEYTGYWSVTNASGVTFGTPVYVIIDVTIDATATPTSPLDTPTASATDIAPTATDIVISTSTETLQPTLTASPRPEVPTSTSTNPPVPSPTNSPLPTSTQIPISTSTP